MFIIYCSKKIIQISLDRIGRFKSYSRHQVKQPFSMIRTLAIRLPATKGLPPRKPELAPSGFPRGRPFSLR